MFLTSYFLRTTRKILLPLLILVITAMPAMAEGPKEPSSLNNPFVTLMVIIIAFLALIIFMMGRLVIGSGGLYLERWKKEKEEQDKKSAAPSVVATLALVLLSVHAFAQSSTPAPVAADNYNGVTPTAYYLLCSVVFIELLLVAVLLYMLRVFAGIQSKKKAIVTGKYIEAAVPAGSQLSWWDKFNALKPLQEEVSLDLGHDYDGIRELDNRLPPWWIWGFVATIFFAIIYTYMHLVSHSAMSPTQEYQASVKQAAIEAEAYLKKSASNVDETTVKLLTDDADIAAGKVIFQTSCFPCHGKNGEGIVGPNLTDDYWLHGGSVQDIFKTIKYGWVDKGMKSWKDDFSPVQIAQISSYVKSLRGTKPANPKAPQGALYTDAGTTQDVKKDSTVAKKAS